MSKIYNSSINIAEVKQYNKDTETTDFQLNVLIQSKDLKELEEIQRVIFEKMGGGKSIAVPMNGTFGGNVNLCSNDPK